MFKKVLIANRGEIAVRIVRACRELDIASVAVYSDADRQAMHVGLADEAYHIGPPAAAHSYLDADRIFWAARTAGCDAVHPGYGFFAENAGFARRCAAERLTFIGPSAAAIERMGDKVAARSAALAAQVPVVPGTIESLKSAGEARAAARRFGYPVAIKAAAGGGGKGLKIARNDGELDSALSLAAKEAAAFFDDDRLYVERYVSDAKHVEVQILADRHGHVIHLGERDCSMQRRHQKLVEETPACISAALRSRLHAAAIKLAASIGYDSAGTVECLVQGDEFYFLEMNTRIQVEHTISEMAWGLDLLKAQIRIACGEPLWFAQADLRARGHAIECRVNAESPGKGFQPCAGSISRYAEPAGPGVRVDGAAFAGWTIPQEYDSLLAKLAVWGENREEARRRMLRALDEFDIQGVDTTVPFFQSLLTQPAFVRADYTTASVEAAAAQWRGKTDAKGSTRAPRPAVQGDTHAPATLVVEVNGKRFEVLILGAPADTAGAPTGATTKRATKSKPPKSSSIDSPRVVAPMHGIVADLKVAPGDTVADGQVVAIIEAMKMMNEVIAHRGGSVKSVDVAIGETVETGTALITLLEG